MRYVPIVLVTQLNTVRRLRIQLLSALREELLMVGNFLEDLLILTLDALILVLHLHVLVHQLFVLVVELAKLSLQLKQLALQNVGVVRVEFGEVGAAL